MQHQHPHKTIPSYILPIIGIFIVLGIFIIYGFVRINSLSLQIDSLTEDLALTNRELSNNTSQLAKNVTDLNKQTVGLSKTLTNTERSIAAVKTQVGGVEQSVGTISGTVNTLQKLAQIDPQLLNKYSKVYFLNENYTPTHLTDIPTEYLYSEQRREQFLTESWPYLENLLKNAKASGVTIYVKSGYRSFAEQKSLKTSYSVTYGAGTANAFSADQGYSEHQLGTTIDFITTGIGGQLSGFGETKAYTWLLDNAHLYGFVLSYPKGNKYYIYEPWHWRFVGVKLATYLHTNNLNFYDIDQRDIDTYRVNMFD